MEYFIIGWYLFGLICTTVGCFKVVDELGIKDIIEIGAVSILGIFCIIILLSAIYDEKI